MTTGIALALGFGAFLLSAAAMGSPRQQGIPDEMREDLDRNFARIEGADVRSVDDLRALQRSLFDAMSEIGAKYPLSREDAIEILTDEAGRLARALRVRWPSLYSQMTAGRIITGQVPGG